jgi:hypothetical protein
MIKVTLVDALTDRAAALASCMNEINKLRSGIGRGFLTVS